MSKPIFMSEEQIEEILQKVKSNLTTHKCIGDQTVKLPSFKADDKFADIYFTSTAWLKMQVLIDEYSSEVQWHGLVRRVSETEFEVYDIIVPPHTVTATTVTSDPVEYAKWLNGLDDDTFNALHFHGHSHVMMHVSPSEVDMTYRRDVITQLPKPTESNDEFYIFLIMNKKGDWSGEIYDLTNNTYYSSDDSDIYIDVVCDDDRLISEFLREAKKVAVQEYTKVLTGTQKTAQNYSKNTPQANNKNSSIPAANASNKSNNTSNYSSYPGYDDYDDYNDPFYSRDGRWW